MVLVLTVRVLGFSGNALFDRAALPQPSSIPQDGHTRGSDAPH